MKEPADRRTHEGVESSIGLRRTLRLNSKSCGPFVPERFDRVGPAGLVGLTRIAQLVPRGGEVETGSRMVSITLPTAVPSASVISWPRMGPAIRELIDATQFLHPPGSIERSSRSELRKPVSSSIEAVSWASTTAATTCESSAIVLISRSMARSAAYCFHHARVFHPCS